MDKQGRVGKDLGRLSKTDLRTPAFAVDYDAARTNIERVAAWCTSQSPKFHLRPHVKTHKSLSLSALQNAAPGTCGLVVSTLAEAEHLLNNAGTPRSEWMLAGLPAAESLDILYGVALTPDKVPRVLELARHLGRFRIMLDCAEGVRAIESAIEECVAAKKEAARGEFSKLDVFLKIDTGYHRAGVDVVADPGGAIELARLIAASQRLRLCGIYTHAGHSYGAGGEEDLSRFFQEEIRETDRFARALLRAEIAGITEEKIASHEFAVAVGSTPTVLGGGVANESFRRDKDTLVNEVHPGNYVLFDRHQWDIGSARNGGIIAGTLLTRVLSVYPARGEILLDCGALSLSKDPGASHLKSAADDVATTTFGTIVGHESSLDLVKISQECGVARARKGFKVSFDTFPIGSILEIEPNHSCLTAACHPEFLIFRDGKIVAREIPCKGW